jgi:hypothetical protein
MRDMRPTTVRVLIVDVIVLASAVAAAEVGTWGAVALLLVVAACGWKIIGAEDGR